MAAGPKILGIIVSVVAVTLVALIALTDEWTNCHFHNWSAGYFSARSLPPGLAVSGDAANKTIDFRRINGVTDVCLVSIPYYGEPTFTRSAIDRGYRRARPMACWRDTPGTIIVVAKSKDMSLAWEQIDVGDPYRFYASGEKECAEIENAVLTCRDEVCEFSR